MTYRSNRRTIRRCTVVLAVPLSLIPMLLVTELQSVGYPTGDLIVELGDELGLLVLLGAILFLLGSAALQVKHISEAERVPSSHGTE